MLKSSRYYKFASRDRNISLDNIFGSSTSTFLSTITVDELRSDNISASVTDEYEFTSCNDNSRETENYCETEFRPY